MSRWRELVSYARRLLFDEVDQLRRCFGPLPTPDLTPYSRLRGAKKTEAINTLRMQYEILESEKRMLQQIANAVVAFLVAGAVGAVVAYGQGQSAIAQVQSAGAATDVIETARRGINTVPILVPPAMFGGGIFLVSLHARVRRVTSAAAHVERLIDATIGARVSLVGWERLGQTVRRGIKWTRHMLAFGSTLAVVAWLFVAQPAVDRGGAPIEPVQYFSVNAFLLFLLVAGAISHRLDQRYYERTVAFSFRLNV